MCKKNELEEQESFFASILPEDNKQKNGFRNFSFLILLMQYTITRLSI
jgi:hypothetical protein